MQQGTTGLLNHINELYMCSSKAKTVSIIKLIQHHNPKQGAELEALINSHQSGTCKCGCKSQGNLLSFARYLYESYRDYSKSNEVEYKSLDDCIVFMKTLFIDNSLRGNRMEMKVLQMLNKSKEILKINGVIEKSSELQDFKYGVDLVMKLSNTEVLGIQVKPISYKNFSNIHPVVLTNLNKNKLYLKPIVYIYYDKNNNILDVENTSKEILKHLSVGSHQH